ncbi:hypothetical protein C8R47DRAFT_997461, partial [Mycena vitilis]
IQIPGDRLCIRLFPGGTRPESGMFFFDFFDAQTDMAVNAPRGYTVTVISPRALGGALASLEHTMANAAGHSVTAANATGPGQERFPVMERVRCSLERPGLRSYLFDIPARTREESSPVGQAVPVRRTRRGYH